jgi:Sec-independent protein secretion pathway component TatC
LEDLVDVYLTLLISLTIMLLVGSTLLPIKNRKTYLFINLLAASLATPPEIKSLMLTLISVCALLESLTLLRVLKVEYIKEKVKSGVDSR